MLLGLLLVSFVILVALITVLSGIGVAEHGGIGSGGVYSMISSVLGGQMGGTVGLLYVFGQVRPQREPTPCLYLFLCHHLLFPFLVCQGKQGWRQGPHLMETTLGSGGSSHQQSRLGA